MNKRKKRSNEWADFEKDIAPYHRFGKNSLRKYIGEAAGKIWKCLGKCGRITDKEISKNTGLIPTRVQMALGWLSCERKLWAYENIKTKMRTWCLNPVEIKKYQKTGRYQKTKLEDLPETQYFKGGLRYVDRKSGKPTK